MSRLGRNPFDKKTAPSPSKKPLRALDIARETEEISVKKSGVCTRFLKFLVVDVRAESYLLGLKTYLLSISLFE
jgi:hypothetical protein